MDLAAAVGARATCMSQLCAGEEQLADKGQELHRAMGQTTSRPLGAGQRVSPEPGTWRVLQASRLGMRLGIYYFD